MPYVTLPDGFPEPPPIPKRYWVDEEWMGDHLTELTQQYPDLWIAVYSKEVVAFGKNLGEVERRAKEKSGGEPCCLWLTESRPRWYSH
ncbi:MAG: hypothetical protein HY318_04000 [Armatimonadetes bacterium]|nr:hypothetical protein [Armatimonadota bacterium]